MNVGVKRADELNLECWMEASGTGKPLYETFGFKPVAPIEFDTEKDNASDTWLKCQHELIPSTITGMWRPKGGVWSRDNGVVEGPWDTDVD